MHVGMSAFRFNHEGGIERASYELATALGDGGDRVTLIAESVDPAPSGRLDWQRVTMPPTPTPFIPWTYPRRATRTISGRAFDVLHNQGACALMAQDVITAHSCHRAWWEMKFRQGEAVRALLNPQHHVVLDMERRNYRPGAYSRVIAVSVGVGLELTHHYGVPADRIRVIPNAVDLAKFQAPDGAEVRARVRTTYGFADDDVVLLFVAKEFRRKGLRPLVEALPHLPDRTRVLVVGGDEQAPYRHLASELGVGGRIVFAGHSLRVQDFFSASDIFVFPTLYEAFALVTLEAAASGLPLVTTKVNGTEDFVVEGSNGVFITRDAASIARAVTPLIDDTALRKRLGDAARRGVGGYTWDRMAARTREVYEEVVLERSTRPGP